jgi:glycosyltransferase involved in cell wall biosynthesis
VRAQEAWPVWLVVMWGSIDPRYPDPRDWIAGRPFADTAFHLGHVSEAQLQRLYHDAAFVAVPSRYEGFGLPALEAASRGRAVLASDVSALREVLGEDAVYCPPGDLDAWAEAMVRLASDPDLCADLGERGRKRVARFSPETLGRETIEVLLATAEA